MYVEELFPVLYVTSYLIMGLSIGIVETQSAPIFQSANSREHPHRHVLTQMFIWPLTYIIFNRVYVLSKIIKTAIACTVFFYMQGFGYKYISEYLGTWALLPAIIITILIAPLVLGLLRMPQLGDTPLE